MTMNPTGKDLLRVALLSLDDAYQAETTSQRYIASHLAALRAGAALLAVRAKPTRNSRPRSVWELLPRVAPELSEWSTYFAAIGRRRVFVEIGSQAVSQRQADDLMRDAEAFLSLIASMLDVGLPIPMPLDAHMRPTG